MKGPSATWRHPRGHGLRRDYVLLDHPAFQLSRRSYVINDLDGGFGHADHCPAAIELTGLVPPSPPSSKPRWDYVKMHDKQAQAQFAQAPAPLLIPSWHIQIDDHAALFETNIFLHANSILVHPPNSGTGPCSQRPLWLAFN